MASSVAAAGVGLPGRTLHEANQQELEATLRLLGSLEYEDIVLVTLGRHVVEDAADHSAEVLRASDGLTPDETHCHEVHLLVPDPPGPPLLDPPRSLPSKLSRNAI